jgi:hypothetical protein
MPALQSFLIEPIWDQFSALLPADPAPHPLVGHRPRIPDRIVFDKLVQVLVVKTHENDASMVCQAARASSRSATMTR